MMGRGPDFSQGVGFCVVALPLAVVATIRDLRAWPTPFIVLAFLFIYTSQTKLRERRFRRDVQWLCGVIGHALTAPPNHPP